MAHSENGLGDEKEAFSIAVRDVQATTWDQVNTEDACRALNVDPSRGLVAPQVMRRLSAFGPNAIEEKKVHPILQFLSYMNNPLSYVMIGAAVLSIGATYGCCPTGPPDWQDFIAFVEERNAANAVAALKKALSQKARVLRGGEWNVIDAEGLVPGDIISVRLGDQVPADAKVIQGEDLKVDQSSLTGESLPSSKAPGDILFSGSALKQGEAEAVVVGTGADTTFGRSLALVASTGPSKHFQQVQNAVGFFCLGYIASFLVFLVWTQWGIMHYSYRTGIENVIVLLLGGVPIAMPVVLSVTLAVGASRLADHKAIVTRISAIEELAGMNMLCSDKTGTLTLNKLSVVRDELLLYGGKSLDELVMAAARASRTANMDAIDSVCVGALGPDGPALARQGITELHFAPFDPVGKKTVITYRDGKDGRLYRASKGYPPMVLALCHPDPALAQRVDADLDALARRGFRGLGVAACAVQGGGAGAEVEGPVTAEDPPSGPWTFLGTIPIFDPPRSDSAATIRRALELSVPVKMITGDAVAIAKETGRMLGLGTHMYAASAFFSKEGLKERVPGPDGKEMDSGDLIEEADGFAGVHPEHKFWLCEALQRRGFIVGMIGDGVNDAPALKKANIGIAAAGATDAARGAADVVLTAEGLSVVVEAILEARRVFQRLLNYLIYAVASTVGVVTRFSIAVWAFRFNMPPFMLLLLVVLNDGTIMAISTDRVLSSPVPDRWGFSLIFTQGMALGMWMALSTLIFIFTVNRTSMWTDWTNNWRAEQLTHPYDGLDSGINDYEFHALVYLQVSVLAQALIFSTRSRYLFFTQRPSNLLFLAFVVAQLVATMIAVYADWGFARIRGIGWAWALSVWLWDIVWFLGFDLIKIAIRCAFEGSWRHPFLPPRHGEAVLAETVDPVTKEVSLKIDGTSVPGRALGRAEVARRSMMPSTPSAGGGEMASAAQRRSSASRARGASVPASPESASETPAIVL